MRKTVTDIFYEYDTKRNRCESIAKANLKELMEKYPKLREMKITHDGVYFSAMRLAALNPASHEDVMAEAKEKAQQIMTKMNNFCIDNGIDFSVTKPKYACKSCCDTGYIIENDIKSLCPCIIERMRTEVYGGYLVDNLEGSFDKYDITVFKNAQQRSKAQKLKKFAYSYCEDERKLYALFEGKAGLGKSYLMHCMAKELKNKGRDVMFIGAFNMFECFKLNRIGELKNLSPIMDAKYLFIDDLGSEPITQNVTREYFFNLIEHRTAKKLHTILSTNLDECELKERYSEKVMSRLLADKDADVIEFIGEDIRLGRK